MRYVVVAYVKFAYILDTYKNCARYSGTTTKFELYFAFHGVCVPSIKTVNKEVHELINGQTGNHFADDIFKCIFVNEMCIWTKISL